MGAAVPAPRGLARLRMVSIALSAIVIVGAVGVVAVVEVVTHNPPTLTVAQMTARVRMSVVTVKATVFRDGASEGQGFLFGGSGHVLTSAHVVAHATKISVVNARGETGSAALVGVDRSRDIAELLTSDRATAPLVATSGPVGVGTKVVLVGNNYSVLPYTVLLGAVSGTGGQVTLKSRTVGDLIKTDLVVHPANSGGPIVTTAGQVVGMVEPDDAGHALVIPASAFTSEARAWAKEDNLVRLTPPLVAGDPSKLVLAGVPLDGFAQTKSEAWAGTGIHVVYLRPPTYEYGGAAIDIYIDVEVQDFDARNLFGVGGSVSNGFSIVANSSELGDGAVFLQRVTSRQVVYEVAWRDRNVNVYMYLGSGTPPAPDVSLQTLIGLAVQQEVPIGANLADW